MLFLDDFALVIEYDANGPRVQIRHRPTMLELEARPASTEKVADAIEKLKQSLRAQLCDDREFEVQIGRCGDGEKIGGFTHVVHRPSGKERWHDSLHNVSRADVWAMKSDIAEELWREQF